mmetsp:Transcript_9081/g.11901  ORF Transcript_9081/g.11901 Transcript_9081/m.11901 type:complete len:453 (+) Transcript_9081:109-1467(+)
MLLSIIAFILTTLAVAFINFLLTSGFLKVFLNIVLGPFIPAFKINRWISNIPGNPTSLDHLTAAFFGPYPEMNDFNAVLAGVPLKDGPVLLEGLAPTKCRYYSFQLFLPGEKSNSPKQCLRDRDMEVIDGHYNIVISTLSEKPKWVTKNWIEVPEGSKRCILCLRTYCPEMGVGFQAPNVWYGCRDVLKKNTNSFASAIHKAGSPESIGDRDRVMGMYPAQIGRGATHQRLYDAIVFNALVLLSCGTYTSSSPALITYLYGWNPIPFVHVCLPLSALIGLGLYKYAFISVAKLYKKNMLSKNLIPNSDVLVPDPKGDLKGHPNHLYYTIHYDATKNDVKVVGIKNHPGFTYTSVTCYGWSSLPPTNGQFRYDETLKADHDVMSPDEKKKSQVDGEKYTVYLTTKPTYLPGINEIDVSQEPSGVCLIRLIYPDSTELVNKCTPQVEPVTIGVR